MSEAIKQASKALTDEFIRSLRDGDGWFPEGDERLNDASQTVARAYHKHYGECWIGQCNPPKKDNAQVLAKYDPSERLFGGSFVVPTDDAELRRLMVERLEAPYTGTTEDAQRIDAIFARMEQIGGRGLSWS